MKRLRVIGWVHSKICTKQTFFDDVSSWNELLCRVFAFAFGKTVLVFFAWKIHLKSQDHSFLHRTRNWKPLWQGIASVLIFDWVLRVICDNWEGGIGQRECVIIINKRPHHVVLPVVIIVECLHTIVVAPENITIQMYPLPNLCGHRASLLSRKK